IEIVDERVYSLNENTSIHFEFIHNEPTKIVNKSIEIAIYRILQELISNIIKHAEATKTTIQLNFDTNIIQVIVEDNGNGFDNTN
ncbi:sensor histidine kinase, partial [Shewanella algae]|uniref:sensor histidine kinase n=1 Tax=Shewanella algae TaxID=38313 RepID=UPI00313E3E70